jgi:CRP/FNR family transcriptional regulator, anaerobic regulatory protein
MSKLLEHLSRYYALDKEVQDKLMASVVTTKYSRGDTILGIGQYCKDIYFLEEGLVRCYYEDAKHDQYTCLIFEENRLFSSYMSYATRQPSLIAIEATENCVVTSLAREHNDEISASYEQWARLQHNVLQRAYIRLQEHNMMLQSMAATERYEYFITTYPSIAQRINLGHIATYLGINQATLSRIRSKSR